MKLPSGGFCDVTCELRMLLKGRKGEENTCFIELSRVQAVTHIHKDVSDRKRM